MIRRLSVDAELNGPEPGGFTLQRILPDMCQHRLAPAIERVLDKWSTEQGNVYIERLEIDAGTLNLENLEHELPAAVTRAIDEKLSGLLPSSESPARDLSSGIRHKTSQQSIHEALVHFLTTGSLPWWLHLPDGNTLEQIMIDLWGETTPPSNVPAHIRHMIFDALGSAASRMRLVQQFSPDFLGKLLEMLSPEGQMAVTEVHQILDGSGLPGAARKKISRHLWLTAFSMLADGKPQTASALADSVGRFAQQNNLDIPALPVSLGSSSPGFDHVVNADTRNTHDRLSQETISSDSGSSTANKHTAPRDMARNAEASSLVDLKEGLYINCAGVVLLHPFIPHFFEALNIAHESKLLQPERALCLLHYLATGQRVAPEYELPLPKLLCNMPLDYPAESDVDLTAAELEEAAALLNAAIGHWKALGSTSADGLRGTFLVRPGKLAQRDDGDWTLQVESRSFDILLDQLPWGIGMIKLPWMEKMLWVEWR